MEVDNKTCYDTKDLCKLIRRGLKESGMDPAPYQITVVHARQNAYISGWGRYGHPRIHLRLPRQDLSVGELANVLEHEIAHNRGIRHRDMSRDCHSCHSKEVPAWAAGLVIRSRPIRSGLTTQERVERRETHARAMLARWERRMRLTRTMLSKWKRRVAYYAAKRKVED